ncbi:MAG: hypothetical protein QOH97_1583 [Actinoplanes sp.]|jgi:hypothetical protein|nr:hypothetical protein [Actinoplanes sp.]
MSYEYPISRPSLDGRELEYVTSTPHTGLTATDRDFIVGTVREFYEV